MSQTLQPTITKPTMKFGQLIEYNMRNIFPEKSYTKCGGEDSPRPFYQKNQNWTILWICLLIANQQPEILQSLFPLYVQVEVYQNILKLRCWPLATTLGKALKKKKKWDLKLVSLPHFLHGFWRKIFLTLYFNWANFIPWLHLLLEILGNMFLVIICCLVWSERHQKLILKLTIPFLSGHFSKSKM